MSSIFHTYLWVPNSHFATNIKMKCLSLLKSYIPSSWVVTCSLCHAVNAGDSITADRYVISFIKFIADTTTIVELDCSENQVSTWGFQSCMNLESNLKPIMNKFKLPPPIQYIDPKYPCIINHSLFSYVSYVSCRPNELK